MVCIARFCSVLLLSAMGFCQLPSTCDSIQSTIKDCISLIGIDPAQNEQLVGTVPSATSLFPRASANRESKPMNFTADASKTKPSAIGNDFSVSANMLVLTRSRKPGFRWKRALFESFTFLSIEQAYVVKDDFRWVVIENGVPFNHYWSDYKQSLSTWVHSGWDDGDQVLYSYVGHPIQGAMAGYIQIQNDPQGEKLEFSNTKAYWWSRFKALLWNAAYSTQWNIGPLSELTVEKYGTTARQPWNQNGTWPCTKKPCVTGVGQVDLVITPVGGFAWILTGDLLDKHVAHHLEGATRNRFLIDVVRCALNPIRGGANMLHGRRPWYRATRDSGQMYSSVEH